MARPDKKAAEDGDNVSEPNPSRRDEALPGWSYPGLDFPTFRLTLLAKAIDRLTLRTFGDYCELTLAEWRVLSRLAPLDGATVRQVAQMAWVDRAETSRAASSLKARGLVDQRDNPADRRAPILFLTAAGQAEYARLLPVRAEFHHRLTEELSQDERATLDALLGKIAKKMSRAAGD
jgi:DNA-binding MarR family transcriptional regulator